MEGAFFDEEDHNTNKKFIMDLTAALMREELDDLHYNAMCGYWTMDEEMLKAMKQAGYYKIRIGIETASSTIAKAIKKKIDIPKVKEMLQQSKKVGLLTYGTFTIGARGSNWQEDMKTVRLISEFINEGLLDGLQISITTPQPGTPFYYWAKEQGYLISEDWAHFDGGCNAVVSYPDYSNKQIEEMFCLANEIANHKLLKRRLAQQGASALVMATWHKYGFVQTLLKIARRLLRELKYLLLSQRKDL